MIVDSTRGRSFNPSDDQFHCSVTFVKHLLGLNLAYPMTQEIARDTITEETGNVMQGSGQGEDNATTSVDHSKATVDSGSSGWEQDFDRLRARMSTQLKAWEDSQRSSVTKQLESFRTQQELQILKSIRSEALEAQTRLDNQAEELQNALDICRKEWEEMSKECQTLRARERQLAEDLSETRLALTRQTLDHQADKVKLLEELNTAKSALQLHQIKVLEEKNAARSAQVKPLEEPSTASDGPAETTAGVNVAKMKKLENDEFDGSEIASDGEAHTEETASQKELRVQELGRMGPINEGPPDVVVPRPPQAGGYRASPRAATKMGNVDLDEPRNVQYRRFLQCISAS
ncbi:hypothetical protein H1R20_g12608, partial [Candolleomyces eurysporus]